MNATELQEFTQNFKDVLEETINKHCKMFEEQTGLTVEKITSEAREFRLASGTKNIGRNIEFKITI